MRISWNWLSEMVDLSMVGGPAALAELYTQRGLEVEAIERQGEGFENVVTAQILSRDPHPQADRLSLCKVTIGAGEPLQIVCGAQNMKAGDTVALAQVGAALPNGLKIAQSKIRGVESHGMLCSEEELKLKDKSEGILILPESTPLGKPLAEVLGRNDTILVFKLTANRGDCMSHWGMAREIAAALGQKPRRPEAQVISMGGSPVALALEAGELSPQFWGVAIEGVKIGPSPAWLAQRLESLGVRSINNVVDATNYVMLEVGHPMHAYDSEQIQGAKLLVRVSREGEELPLLDGQNVKLTGHELVIADGERAVALAGVMGGGNSEVRDGTTRLFLECAEFSPVWVRRTAGRFARRTEAAQRFEKGVDPAGLEYAVTRLARLITQVAGGTVKGATLAALPSRSPETAAYGRTIAVEPGYFERFLGMELMPNEIGGVLASLDCKVIRSGEEWRVTTPSYRLDLVIREDLAEEVARCLGYDKIPATVPVLTSLPSPQMSEPGSARRLLVERAKDALVRAGLAETLNFSFTSKARLAEFGMTTSAPLVNPLSEEHEALIPSLLPNLVHNALENWRRHFGSELLPIRLFEIRPTFHATDGIAAKGDMETGVQERWKLALALSGPRVAGGLRKEQGEVDFYDLKAVVESLLEQLGARGVRFAPPRPGNADPAAALFHPGQSVEVLAGSQLAGWMGLLHPSKAREYKTRSPLWLCELEWDAVAKLSRQVGQSAVFKAWSEFPPMERDFALLVRGDLAAERITQVALKVGKPIAKVAKVFDTYRGHPVPEGMTSIAVRVVFFGEGRSLQESETEAVSVKILEAWKNELGIELRA